MKSGAFSLIELMVVIAIVGLLSVVAVPAYSNYMLKAKVGSALQLAKPVITNISTYYSIHGHFPALASDVLPSTDGGSWSSGAGGAMLIDSPFIDNVAYLGYFNNNVSPPLAAGIAVGFKRGIGFDRVEGSSAIPAVIFVVYPETDGTLGVKCGLWDPAVDYIDVKPELLPDSCSERDIFHDFGN